MSIVLETAADRQLEEKAISRVVQNARSGTKAYRMNDFSCVDYMLTLNGEITAAVEIKTRKESVEQIKSYGGLILKHRKLIELHNLHRMLRVPCVVAFAFENAEGPIAICLAYSILDLEPKDPPKRRNFRGLECDEEPVVYLDWDKHLIWI